MSNLSLVVVADDGLEVDPELKELTVPYASGAGSLGSAAKDLL